MTGLIDAAVDVIGSETRSGGDPVIEVGPDQTREIRVLVTTHQMLEPEVSIPLTFTIVSTKNAVAASAHDHFTGS